MAGGLKGLLDRIWNGFDEPAVKLRDSPGPRGFMIGSGGSYTYVPRLLTSQNVEETPWLNSAFFGCMRWMAETFSEAPFVVQKWDEDREKWLTVRNHSLAKLFRRPNPYYTSSGLFAGILLSRGSAGDSFILKRRNEDLLPVELWYLSHQDVHIEYQPIRDHAFIGGYRIGSEFTNDLIKPYNMIHVRNMLDPNTGGREGLSPLDGFKWELKSDQEGAMSVYNVLHNMGFMVPVFSPKNEETEIDDVGANTIINTYVNRSTGVERGKPVVFSDPMDVSVIQVKPRDMDYGSLRTSAMTRVCVALGVDPLVIGLSGEQATYKNKSEAREASYEGAIIPVQRQLCEQFDMQILPDFEPDPWNYRCWFDISDVRILQKDLNELSDRVSRLYMAKVVDRYEAKTMLRMDASSEDKGVYYEQSEDGEDDQLTKKGRNSPQVGSTQTKT